MFFLFLACCFSISHMLPSIHHPFPLLSNIPSYPPYLCILTFSCLLYHLFLHILLLPLTMPFLYSCSFPNSYPLFLDSHDSPNILSSRLTSSYYAISLFFHYCLFLVSPLSSTLTSPLMLNIPSCLISSLQSPGVAGPPLPRSAPAGLCQLAAGPLPALHLYHRLLQHLERSQDVWKGN